MNPVGIRSRPGRADLQHRTGAVPHL